MHKNKFRFFLILLATFFIGYQTNNLFSKDKLFDAIKKINTVLKLTSENYYKDIEPDKLSEEAIKGMFSSLDPHTIYLPPKKQRTENEKLNGSFNGVGIEYQIIQDTLTVVAPMVGGPSEQVGIRSGDKFIKIGNQSCIGITQSEIHRKLRGPIGSRVDVTILRPFTKEILKFEIIRNKISIHSVVTSFMIDNKTGYVKLSGFAKTTTAEMITALNSLSELGMENLILDLRNNPGGLLSQAITLTDLFIPGNQKILFTKGKTKESFQNFYSMIKTKYENIPLIILINRGSASASEILSGAVQDLDRGLIVGETSFGKGLVQRVFELEDKSAIRLTVAKYFTPSGRAIQREFSNKKNYYNSVLKRKTNSADNFLHSIDTTKNELKYLTKNGRKVFGRGGITPDYIIKPDSLSKTIVNILMKNLFYLFVRKNLDEDNFMLKYLTLNQFIAEFETEKSLLFAFKSFVKKRIKDINFNNQDISTCKRYLKAYFAKEKWGKKAWYKIVLKSDNQLQKGLKLIPKAKTMLES